MRQSFYAVVAVDDATGREVGWTTRAVLSNAMKAARWFAGRGAVTVTVVKVGEGSR